MRDRVVTFFPDSARLCACVIACITWTMALSGCGSAPAEPVTESITELDVRDGEQPEVHKSLAAGTWLLEVRERDIDVRATFEAPGMQANPLESTPRHGVVYAVVSLDEPAEVRVQLPSGD